MIIFEVPKIDKKISMYIKLEVCIISLNLSRLILLYFYLQ